MSIDFAATERTERSRLTGGSVRGLLVAVTALELVVLSVLERGGGGAGSEGREEERDSELHVELESWVERLSLSEE